MILVTGANGQLGTALRNLLGSQATYLTRSDLDLGHPETFPRIIHDLRPKLLVNCAAYTAVDQAEAEPEQAMRVNATAVGRLAAAAAGAGAGFVTFSTDYVFDGRADRPYTESSVPNPLNQYGTSKLAGERSALSAHPEALVIRTSWLLSGTHQNFVSRILELARQRPLRVVDDQRGHPTMAADLAVATLEAVERGASGLLHLTNAGVSSWFELARECLQLAGIDQERVTPCSTEEFPRPARRPANSVLESERISVLGLSSLPHYRDGLSRAVTALSPT